MVLPKDATPYPVDPGKATADDAAAPVWNGARVTVKRTDADVPEEDQRTEEMVLLMQDGLRLFLNGNNHFPLPDPSEEAEEAEEEDQGQKGFNYRTEPLGRFDPLPSDYSLSKPDPATPIWTVPVTKVRFHLVGALDKPRNYSFTIHGVAWPEHRFVPPSGRRPIVSSESALSCGTTRTFEFTPAHRGDHAYRSGVLKWAVPQGMWGILRVE